MGPKQATVFKTNKHLLPLKGVLFFYNGAYACLLPYLAVHMKQIGITVEETAIIHSIIPLSAFSGPPVAGFLADKFGGYKVILIFSLIFNAAFHTALLTVPPVETVFTTPLDELQFPFSSEPFLRVNTCEGSADCQLLLNGTIGGHILLNECRVTCAYGGNGHVEESTARPRCRHNETLECGPPYDDDDGPRIDLRISSACRRIDRTGCSYDIHEMRYSSEVEGGGAVIRSPLTIPGAGCTVVCPLSLDENNLASEKKCEHELGNKSLTFWMYLVLRVLASAFLSSCLSLLDTTTLVMMKAHDGEYGKQRLWSILSTAVFPPIAGILVDYASHLKGYSDYSPTFFMFDGLILITVLLAFRLDVHIKMESDTKVKDVLKLLRSFEVCMLLVAVLVLGTMWGYIETFLYWYLLDLGSPRYLLGLTLTVGSGISVPVMYAAEAIVNKVGHANILVGACFMYCFRYMGYSFIYDAWYALVFECMEVFTIHLMWVAAITYGAALSPEGLLATVQGTICGVHYGMGRGMGSFIGGLLMHNFGTRYAYRCMGIGCAVFGAFYCLYSLTYIRHKNRKLHVQKERARQMQLFVDKSCSKEAEAMLRAGTVGPADDDVTGPGRVSGRPSCCSHHSSTCSRRNSNAVASSASAKPVESNEIPTETV